MHTPAELLDIAFYECYKEQRRLGVSHEDCVRLLGMPDFFRRRLDDEIVEKMKYAFGLYNEEEN